MGDQIVLNRLFHLEKNHTNPKLECLAGISTFLTMSYILFVNPSLLAQTGMDHGAVFVATCLTAAFGSILMGLLANYPIALAPGMALNTYFTYGVVQGAGYSWQVALGAVFVSAVLFFFISILPIRQYILVAIPKSLKVAIVAGIGLFLAIIGFKNAGLIAGSSATLVTRGDLHHLTVLLAVVGFFMIVAFDALNILGGMIISMLTVTALGIFFGLTEWHGIFALPPDLSATFMHMDVKAALDPNLFMIIIAFLFVELFDNTGTLIGVAHRANLIDADGKLPRVNRALIADSTSALLGAILGTSTTTSYLESVVGVKVGGRTGLTALVVGILFLLSLFLAPLASSIPAYATAPALIYVACLMMKAIVDINWDDVTEYAPAMVTVIAMPLTFSIAEGIGFGFISYVAIKLISGRFRELNITSSVLASVFLLKVVLLT